MPATRVHHCHATAARCDQLMCLRQITAIGESVWGRIKAMALCRKCSSNRSLQKKVERRRGIRIRDRAASFGAEAVAALSTGVLTG
jgi:hypothetical protein